MYLKVILIDLYFHFMLNYFTSETLIQISDLVYTDCIKQAEYKILI